MVVGSQPEEPEWLALPSGDCCLKGHLHTGNPKGSTERIVDIETYVTHPPPEKANGNVILYYPDVFGFFTNGLLVMDEMADAGYLTIGIDYFQGDPIYRHLSSGGFTDPKPGFDFESWKSKYQKFAEENVPGWVEAVKKKYGKPETKYACVGYCFGAPYVCDSLSPKYTGSTPPCEVGAFAHPAFLKEQHFHDLQRPLFLSCAETDFTFDTGSRNKAIDILRNAKKPYHLQLFSGVEHGFALRCDLSKPYARWCKEQSVKGITAYFDVMLSGLSEDEKSAKM